MVERSVYVEAKEVHPGVKAGSRSAGSPAGRQLRAGCPEFGDLFYLITCWKREDEADVGHAPGAAVGEEATPFARKCNELFLIATIPAHPQKPYSSCSKCRK